MNNVAAGPAADTRLPRAVTESLLKRPCYSQQSPRYATSSHKRHRPTSPKPPAAVTSMPCAPARPQGASPRHPRRHQLVTSGRFLNRPETPIRHRAAVTSVTRPARHLASPGEPRGHMLRILRDLSSPRHHTSPREQRCHPGPRAALLIMPSSSSIANAQDRRLDLVV